MFRLRAYSAPLNMTADSEYELGDEIGGEAANLIPFSYDATRHVD
jgi:hypothetical protein